MSDSLVTGKLGSSNHCFISSIPTVEMGQLAETKDKERQKIETMVFKCHANVYNIQINLYFIQCSK